MIKILVKKKTYSSDQRERHREKETDRDRQTGDEVVQEKDSKQRDA